MPKCRVCGQNGGGKIGYCREHLPDEHRCIAYTAAGTRCTDRKVRDIDYCHLHNPDGRFAQQHYGFKPKCQIEGCEVAEYAGSGYCYEHVPRELLCEATTKKGHPCQVLRVEGQRYCKAHLKHHKKQRAKERRNGCGWIYVFDTSFTVKGGRVYKIGFTTQKLKKRIGELQIANPFGSLLFAAYVDGARDVEAEVHKKVKRHRVKREMFRLPMDVVREVRDYLEPLLIDDTTEGNWDV